MFEISRTALAMLSSRLVTDPPARARLSHSIRTNTSESDWLFVSSANLDEFVQRPLPGVEQQLDYLTRWLAGRLGDDYFGRVRIPPAEEIAGVVGAIDVDRVGRLIGYAQEKALVEVDGGTEIGLTPKGWAIAIPQAKDGLPEPEKEPEPAKAAALPTSTPETVKANCNRCGGERNAIRRASYTVDGKVGEISWSNTHDILECCGCGAISIRREVWSSDWDTLEDDPITGDPRVIRRPQVTYWPPPTKREKPDWAVNLGDENLRAVIGEVYQALNAGLIVLASTGTRTLLDRAMYLRVGDPKGGFQGKLNAMVDNGHISADERNILEAITDAGSAAAHRGYTPSPSHLDTIIKTVENFLQREFILKSAASEVKKATPPRPQAPKKSKGP